MRLRRDDLLPADVEKHFEVNPAVQTRPGPLLTSANDGFVGMMGWTVQPIGYTRQRGRRRCGVDFLGINPHNVLHSSVHLGG